MSTPSPKRVLIVFLMLLTHCYATTYFVRSGASGNGTSWANAWGDVSSINSSNLSPGDTVCVAGGTYSGSITTGKSGTSASPITIKRATAADAVCGAGTAGWNASYDAQAVIRGITLQNNYVTIDGVSSVNGGVNNGFLINLSHGAGQAIGVGGPTTGIVLRYIEVSGPCGVSACAQSNDDRSVSLIRWNGNNYDLQTNSLLQYLNLHGACTILISYNSSGLTVEHSRFADSSTTDTTNCHPNVYEDGGDVGFAFRYNEVTNWQVEGIMVCPNGNCTSNGDIYGNVWHDPMTGSYPRVLEAQGGANGPYHVYDNTFVDLYYNCADTANGGSFAGGTAGRNNLFYGNAFANCGLPSEDYDASDQSTGETHAQKIASSIFVNYAARTVAGYHLGSHTSQGTDLGAPYNIDYDGNTRTTWDRGAFEYGGSASGPTPPSGLTALVQ